MQLSTNLTRDLPTSLTRPDQAVTAPRPAAVRSAPAVSVPPAGGADRFSGGDFARVREALSREAEVRAAVVARGRALAANPDYPAPDIAQKIAELLLASH